MNVSLSPELEQFIHSQVEGGKYTSAEEVIQAGIRLLEEQEHTYTCQSPVRKRLRQIRTKIVASGTPLLDRDGIAREVASRQGGLESRDE